MKNAVKLDAKATQEVLESAVRTQGQVILECAAWGNITVNGFLISGDDKALLMEVTGKPALMASSLVGVKCGGQLYCDHRYLLNTTITAAPEWGETRCLALARPTQLSMLDRRRFARAQLAPSSQVKLEWIRDGLARRYVAALLNISPDGLSCRLEAAVAESVEAGDFLTTRFNLPGQTREFVLEAKVLNFTRGAEGRTILGVQFAPSQRYAAAIVTLRQVLGGRPQPAELEAVR